MSRIPPEATDPASAAYKYTVTYVSRESEYDGVGAVPEDVDTERVSFVTATTDQDTVNNRARGKLSARLGYEDTSAVDEHYRRVQTCVAFHDAPWNDVDDLEDALTSIDGVKNALYVSPFRGTYEAPHFRLQVADNTHTQVANAVTSYYPGLTVEQQDMGVKVIVSPLANQSG